MIRFLPLATAFSRTAYVSMNVVAIPETTVLGSPAFSVSTVFAGTVAPVASITRRITSAAVSCPFCAAADPATNKIAATTQRRVTRRFTGPPTPPAILSETADLGALLIPGWQTRADTNRQTAPARRAVRGGPSLAHPTPAAAGSRQT